MKQAYHSSPEHKVTSSGGSFWAYKNKIRLLLTLIVLIIKSHNSFKSNLIYLYQPTTRTLDRSDSTQNSNEKEILKNERRCSSIFCRSTSSLHRNVHTNSLDSSYCFPNHFLTIHSPGTAIQSSIFSTSVNATVCTAQLITAWDESGFYKALWTLKAQRESLLKA